MILSERGGKQYKVLGHLGDGTFGRTLQCLEMRENRVYAVKVIRAVPRYVQSAKTEAQILKELQEQGGCERGIVYLKEWFTHHSYDAKTKQHSANMCLVFEPLGKSLYDFIKDNNFKGFDIDDVREIAR